MKCTTKSSDRWNLRRVSVLGCAVVVVFGFAPRIYGQMVPAGYIREDQTWQGEVLIRQSVTIVGATVRVEPGTTIHFVSEGRRQPPVIQLDSAALVDPGTSSAARLVLDGSADEPITVETPEGHVPGSIATLSTSHGAVVARHTVFRRLGKRLAGERFSPAIRMQLAARNDDFWLKNCRFEQCGPIEASFYATDCGAEITDCHFVKTRGDVALDFSGGGSGVKVVNGNRSDAAFRISCPQILLQENVLIGEKAAITIHALSKKAISIKENYVHCTTTVDAGHYALKCDAAGALLQGNVLKGGTYCVAAAPREVQGNVLIGVSGLKAQFNVPELRVQELKSTTTTHYLLTGLNAEAYVRDNLFLGPAYAGLATAGQVGKVRIEHNLFDGWDQAKRAVYFNMIERDPLHGQLQYNVFTRCKQTPVFDHAGSPDTLNEVGHNIFAGFDGPVYENIPAVKDDAAPGDRRLDSFKQLRFGLGVSTQVADGAEQRLTRDELTVKQVRNMWFDAYQPANSSPLSTGKKPVGPRVFSSTTKPVKH